MCTKVLIKTMILVSGSSRVALVGGKDRDTQLPILTPLASQYFLFNINICFCMCYGMWHWSTNFRTFLVVIWRRPEVASIEDSAADAAWVKPNFPSEPQTADLLVPPLRRHQDFFSGEMLLKVLLSMLASSWFWKMWLPDHEGQSKN